MAYCHRHQPRPSRIACRCKPPRCTPHQGRFRASGDFDGRIEIYTRQSRSQIGFVYIFATEAGPIKIGFSRCVLARLSGLCSIYGTLRLFRAAGTSIRTARKLERAVHSRLSNWAGDLGEWYNATPAAASDILSEELDRLRLKFGSPHKRSNKD